jgi:hypothetical protein
MDAQRVTWLRVLGAVVLLLFGCVAAAGFAVALSGSDLGIVMLMFAFGGLVFGFGIIVADRNRSAR